MDEIMRGMQGRPEETAAVRLGPLRLWLGVAGTHGKHAFRCDGDSRGRVMAKIIEFYIPTTFRKSGKWVPPRERGKVIEFAPETKKTA